MKTYRWSVFFFLACASLFATGCAMTRPELTSYPKLDEDFKLCPEELKKRYADIEQYEGSFSRYILGSRATHPSLDVLVRDWGEPSKRLSLRNLEWPIIFAAFGNSGPWIAGGSAFVIMTLPRTVYTWQKGDYTIDCAVINPIADGYDPFLRYWTWTYRGPGCAGATSVSQRE